ncbi:hypothetical protein OG530_17540 [Streptomyces decoyicus]|uniref:hypothetical protein n=1 Tax=Streptomyces decoyicus TaxID=249567 RepID=UPI002E175A3A
MPHCIARIFEPLLRLLLPPPGRHQGDAFWTAVAGVPLDLRLKRGAAVVAP